MGNILSSMGLMGVVESLMNFYVQGEYPLRVHPAYISIITNNWRILSLVGILFNLLYKQIILAPAAEAPAETAAAEAPVAEAPAVEAPAAEAPAEEAPVAEAPVTEVTPVEVIID